VDVVDVVNVVDVVDVVDVVYLRRTIMFEVVRSP